MRSCRDDFTDFSDGFSQVVEMAVEEIDGMEGRLRGYLAALDRGEVPTGDRIAFLSRLRRELSGYELLVAKQSNGDARASRWASTARSLRDEIGRIEK